VENFDELKVQIANEVDSDGFLYPPLKDTRHPSTVLRLPASHIIEVETPLAGTFRERDGGFLLHLLAYLYGYRLQFSGWWVDGRIPWGCSTHSAAVSDEMAEKFLSVAYSTWQAWDEPQQRHFTNLLYMHSRAPGYFWDWEVFIFESMVLDAVWKHYRRTHDVAAEPPHKKRAETLCAFYSVRCEAEELGRIAEIVELRNDLLHESLWSKSSPGSRIETRAYIRLRQLRCLNQRLIAASLGFTGKYTRSEWLRWKSPHDFV
jgi:hypothetical protein